MPGGEYCPPAARSRLKSASRRRVRATHHLPAACAGVAFTATRPGHNRALHNMHNMQKGTQKSARRAPAGFASQPAAALKSGRLPQKSEGSCSDKPGEITLVVNGTSLLRSGRFR
jgi:hypothetical protein